MFDEAPTSEKYERLNLTGSKSHFHTANGGLGFAMPAAVGGAIAQIERPVVCIVGDGSAPVLDSISVECRKLSYGRDVHRPE